jgi:hypothetical protein
VGADGADVGGRAVGWKEKKALVLAVDGRGAAVDGVISGSCAGGAGGVGSTACWVLCLGLLWFSGSELCL